MKFSLDFIASNFFPFFSIGSKMAAPGLAGLGGYGSGSSSDESDNEAETPKVAPEEKLLHLKVQIQHMHDNINLYIICW